MRGSIDTVGYRFADSLPLAVVKILRPSAFLSKSAISTHPACPYPRAERCLAEIGGQTNGTVSRKPPWRLKVL